MMFEALENGIYRLCIPFENIYTSVFLLVEGENSALIDSGSTDVDSTNYILPALRHAGISPDYLICSHLHGDHCGGIRALCDAYPTAKVGLFSRDIPFQTGSIHLFSDGEILWERFQIFNMQGHTQDSLAALDLKTNTLLTADCLQLFGIGRYGTSVTDVAQYKLTIERIKHFGVQKIIAAHAYVPCGYMAEGVDAVQNYLTVCGQAVDLIEGFVKKQYRQGTGCDVLAKQFCGQYTDLPPINGATVCAFAKSLGLCCH